MRFIPMYFRSTDVTIRNVTLPSKDAVRASLWHGAILYKTRPCSPHPPCAG